MSWKCRRFIGWQKCRIASRVKLGNIGNMDMGVLRGEERCGGREVATAGVKLACRVVRI